MKVRETISPPFPWYGAKRRFTASILTELGDVTVYAEPFAGALHVLLAGPVRKREIVSDTNGHICNFWRAMQRDPEAVAAYADYPTIHQDLTARHAWLIRWGRAHARDLMESPDWYDAKAAGWWAWGVSSWIGGEWCRDDRLEDRRPFVKPHEGGIGVQEQRETLPDKRPHVHHSTGGKGVQVQRLSTPHDQIPNVGSEAGGLGVQAQRATLGGRIGDGSRLLRWFDTLAQRLARVVVFNRSWESIVTPTVLMHTPSAPKPPVGIFLDPPYRTDTGRKTGIYPQDAAGMSNQTAAESYEWAVAHGETYRIAYACHEGDFPVPEGWRTTDKPFPGIRRPSRRSRRDVVMFSPACVGERRQLEMGGLW